MLARLLNRLFVIGEAEMFPEWTKYSPVVGVKIIPEARNALHTRYLFVLRVPLFVPTRWLDAYRTVWEDTFKCPQLRFGINCWTNGNRSYQFACLTAPWDYKETYELLKASRIHSKA